MKRDAWLVNCSRGEVVDETARIGAVEAQGDARRPDLFQLEYSIANIGWPETQNRSN